MHPVPHVLFRFPIDQNAEEPSGEPLTLEISKACRQRGFAVTEIDLWRDSGWFFYATAGDQQFQIYNAAYGSDELLLAVAPPRHPGIIGRLLGKHPTPVGPKLVQLCQIVHQTLKSSSDVSRIRWMFSGPPESVEQFSSPDLLPWPAGE